MPSDTGAAVAGAESRFFRALNAFVEPAVRAGFGAPLLWPTGLIVIETKGRRSGLPQRTPVFATVVGDFAIVGTLRDDRSDWLRNAQAAPDDVRFWLRGSVRDVRALLDPLLADADAVPLPVQWATLAVTALYGPFGRVIVLAPA